MPASLGVAVIGLGVMGTGHARVWAELPATRLIGVYDILPERSTTVAAQHNVKAFASLEAVLADPDVNIISLCTDDQSHHAPAIAAAAAGKHLLIEKPLATTVKEADEIIAACKTAGVKLMVGHIVRFDPRYIVAKQELANGAAGDIIQIFARRNNILPNGRRVAPRTSVAFFLGVHDIDIMRWFVDSEIVRVYAESASKALADIPADDSIFALFKFANGAIGCLEICWVMPEGVTSTLDARMEVIGTSGKVAVRAGDETVEITSATRVNRPDVTYGPEILGLQAGALRTQLEHFAHCVLFDLEPVMPNADARVAVLIAETIHKSLATGQPVAPG